MNYLAQRFKTISLMCPLFLVVAFAGRLYAADQFSDAARELAGKILAIAGPAESVAFRFQLLASLGAQEAAAARKVLETELRSQGMHFAADSKATVNIKVTLSENSRQYLWIAEIQRDQGNQVVMTAQPRVPYAFSKNVALRESIESRLIFEQDDPILDFRLLGEELLILDPGRLALYRRVNEAWNLESSTPLKSSRPLPRDTRGRLSVSGDSVQAQIPGLSCSGTIRPALNLNCSSETRWSLEPGVFDLVPDANYFSSADLPALFSAASVKEDGTELWLIAAEDGHTYIFDRTSKVGTVDGWGNDIAAIESQCGTGHQIFAVLPGDTLDSGVIQAFEILHRKSVAVSSTVEFPGPVTALWPVPGQNAAAAVSRDLKTGRYAAFSLSLSCSR